MLLAKKYEARIDLNDEEYDFLLADVPDEEVLEEFNATCIGFNPSTVILMLDRYMILTLQT
ncbi:hypothetical protein Tco_0494984, partial [Tanacetum coccineum]